MKTHVRVATRLWRCQSVVSQDVAEKPEHVTEVIQRGLCLEKLDKDSGKSSAQASCF
jgi:hypothetical protein